jgi:Region found in RelA / SpoT proteins
VNSNPKLEVSKNELARISEELKGELIWTDSSAERIRYIFSIASQWRDSHAVPMRSIRSQLTADARKLGLSGLAAARLKRMVSVRRKLRRVNENLAQLQDLAGCRIILSDSADVKKLADFYCADKRHKILRSNDYILSPKKDGYRSLHLVLQYADGDFSAEGQSRKVEVQIRTRLQHSWATAVESVGLFTRQDIKGGHGSEDWQRLFFLMSCEIAFAEKGPLPSGAPDRDARVKEIGLLNRRLDAANMLQNLTIAVQYLNTGHLAADAAKYWQLTYDSAAKTVKIEGFVKAKKGTESYGKSEVAIERSHGTKNTVLVEIDEIQNLAAAYPNYFGDVRYFKNNLLRIANGEEAIEFSLPPLATITKAMKVIPDDSWLRHPRNRIWTG